MKKFFTDRNRILKGRTITTWFITFMVISVAQLAVWIVATEMVVRVVKRQTNGVYDMALNILIQSYDNSMESVCSMLDVMALEQDIGKGTGGCGDAWQNEVTRRRLASYRSQYPYIDDIFIYYKDEERVISANTVASSRLFFDVYADMDMSFEEWQDYMRQDFFKQDAARKDMAGRETLWILHTWSTFYGNDTGSVAGVKFNSSYVRGLADRFSENNYVGVTICNANGDLVAQSGNMDNVRQNRKIVRTGEKFGWTYTVYMSDEAVGVYEERVLSVLLICFAAEALALVFAVSFFLRTNYSPFTELVRYVNKQNAKERMDGSEYVYIRDSFEKIVKKSKEDEEEIMNKLGRLRSYQLMHLLKNDIPMENADRRILEEMQLGHIFDCCAVLLIAGEPQTYADIIPWIGMGMQGDNILYGCSFVYENTIVCVFRTDEDPQEVKKKLVCLWERMEREIPGACVMAVSSLVMGCRRLRKAYEEAQFVIQGAKGLCLKGILLYDEVRDCVRENVRDNKDENIVQQVQDYIWQHYDDPELNVGKLCEDMEKSVSYVSRLFKEKTGQNILYYINMVRIENAKKLLRESPQETAIGEIGRATGFTNSNSFIRIFKKYEQITPGKYRELNLFQEGEATEPMDSPSI